MRDRTVSAGDPRVDPIALLADVAARLLATDTAEETAVEVFRLTADHLGLDVFLHYLVALDAARLELKASAGIAAADLTSIASLQFNDCVCGVVAATCKPIVLEHVQHGNDPQAQLVRSLGLRAYACLPLIGKRALMGTVSFGSHSKDTFAPDDLEVLHVVASQVAVAVERARMASRVERELEQRRQTEEALRKSEDKFRAVFERAAIGMGRARFGDARWLDVNDSFCDMLGYGRHEMLRIPWPEMTHPDDVDLDLAAFRRMANGELDDYTVEKRFIHKKGWPVWARLTLSLVRTADGRPDYEVAIIENIADRKRAEHDLRDERDFISAVLDTAASLVVVLDVRGRIVRFNKACEALTGYTQDEIAGQSIEMLIPEAERTGVSQVMDRLAAGAFPSEYENHWMSRDGTRRLLAWCNTALTDESGGVKFIIATGVDITGRKRAEEALREANSRLEEAARRKDEFIAILSHELRNPIAPIRFALPLLQRHPLPDELQRAVTVIDRQLSHLTRLVDDLLDASRITRGKIELRRERTTLASIVNAATEAASPAMYAAGHTLTLRLPHEPLWLFADPARIAQVVTNLLNNSAKFTARGGTIGLEAARENGQAVIRVRDTGTGIPADALPIVFEMFRQVDSPARSQGGLGIGLALARQLVELHGGTIEAHSAGRNRGAEFTVRLPLAAGDGDEQAPADGEAFEAGAAHRRLKVLVVDDNADLVEMLAALVAGLGHDVRTALDGRAAVSAALSYAPDVILLDLGLPGMSGIEVARELRTRTSAPKPRLVALTGWGQAEDRRQTRQAGFDDHLTKPANPQMVARLLDEYSRLAS